MDPERARHAALRLARRRERRREHRGRVGHDGRQKPGDALAPKGASDARHALDGRLGVEQDAAAAIDLPIDEAWGENPAAEIDGLAAARALLDVDEGANDSALNDEGVIVEKPLAVEQARAEEHFHGAGSFRCAIRPPAIRMAPSVASCRGGVSSASTIGSK